MNAAIQIKGPAPTVRFCRECGHPFFPRRTDQDFCTNPCRNAYHKRRTKRGNEVIDFAMEWRGKRLKGGFKKFTQLIDGYLAEERERKKAHKAIRAQFEKQQKG